MQIKVRYRELGMMFTLLATIQYSCSFFQRRITIVGQWRISAIELLKEGELTSADIAAYGWLTIATDSMLLSFTDEDKLLVNNKLVGSYLVQNPDSIICRLVDGDEGKYHVELVSENEIGLTNEDFHISLLKIKE